MGLYETADGGVSDRRSAYRLDIHGWNSGTEMAATVPPCLFSLTNSISLLQSFIFSVYEV